MCFSYFTDIYGGMGREHRFVQNVQKLLASSYLSSYVVLKTFLLRNWMFSTNQRYFLILTCMSGYTNRYKLSNKITKLHSFGKAKRLWYLVSKRGLGTLNSNNLFRHQIWQCPAGWTTFFKSLVWCKAITNQYIYHTLRYMVYVLFTS